MARRVSLARALAVRAYLIDQGIDSLRINVNAAGEKNPGGDPDRVDVYLKKQEGK
jgi:outer membrane protein OmpA-like peptidoglycan-associated protein